MTAPGLPKFCQKGLQVGDSLIDAPSLMLGKVETMYETQGSIVGFLCILDFVFPRSCAA
jgi:hypothetical protein